MPTYLVSYDLAKPTLNGPYLAEAIMSLGAAWARPLANVWYLRAEKSPAEIEARLSRLLDEDDGLLVQETRGDALMLNTGLRWFRQRRSEASDRVSETVRAQTTIHDNNVVAFPAFSGVPERPSVGNLQPATIEPPADNDSHVLPTFEIRAAS